MRARSDIMFLVYTDSAARIPAPRVMCDDQHVNVRDRKAREEVDLSQMITRAQSDKAQPWPSPFGL